MPYGLDERGRPLFLISTMAMHTQNLQADPRASLLVTQPDASGDPLGASRATVIGNAVIIPQPEVGGRTGRATWSVIANAKYWVDFEDFSFYPDGCAGRFIYVGGFGVMGWVQVSDYGPGATGPAGRWSRPESSST